MLSTPISDWYLQGDNLQMAVFDASGRIAPDMVWALADGVGRTVGTVTDYGGMGYKPVKPAEVETLPGGTFRPEKARFGVMFEFDKKSDVLKNAKGLVLLEKTAAAKAREAAALLAAGQRLKRTVTKDEVAVGTRDRMDLGVTTDIEDQGLQTITS